VRWGATAFLENLELIEEIAERQIRRLQLHQAYSYEEFVRGLRLTEHGTVPQDGYLLDLIEEVSKTEAQNGPRRCPGCSSWTKSTAPTSAG
jgi:5-methylcytosine-specific restriction endonuclease McrBC GTP-binding regulatory subunit McrB